MNTIGNWDSLIRVFAILFAGMVMSGCTYVPAVPVASAQMDMRMKNMTPPPDKALLYVYREIAVYSAGDAVTYEISIDGYPAGKLAQATYLVALLESGKHRVTSQQFGDGGQKDLSINAKVGNTYYVETSTRPPFLFVVNEDRARKALTCCELIYESEEPIQITTAKAKPTNVVSTSSSDPITAMVVRSDVDELPSINAKPQKHSYAIVIGIEKYRQRLPNADHAANDAKVMTEYLTKVMGYPAENVVTLTNEQASKSDFEKYFGKWLFNHVEKDSSVFIYYSGHGAPNVNTGDAYLVPYDGDPSFIEETGYPLKRLYESLHKLQAKEIIVALDSCFSGAGGKSVIAQGARPLIMNLEQDFQISRNMIVMSASSGIQISSTYEEKGHGLFTYYLLKGIKDGKIEVGELFDYIKPNVGSTARKIYNNEQTPQLMAPDKQKVFLRY